MTRQEHELAALRMSDADLRERIAVYTAELEKRQDVREKVRDEIRNNPDQWS